MAEKMTNAEKAKMVAGVEAKLKLANPDDLKGMTGKQLVEEHRVGVVMAGPAFQHERWNNAETELLRRLQEGERARADLIEVEAQQDEADRRCTLVCFKLKAAEASRDDWHKVADARSAKLIAAEAERDRLAFILATVTSVEHVTLAADNAALRKALGEIRKISDAGEPSNLLQHEKLSEIKKIAKEALEQK